MVTDKTFAGKMFDLFNILLLSLIAILMLLPFLHVVMGSFTTAEEMARKPFVLFPTVFTFDSYRYIFSTNTLFKAMGVSIGVTVVGTLISMILTSMMAYGLTRRDLDGRKTMNLMIVFTMLFHGGLIPSFLIVKNLGLIDTYMSLILPGAISAFNLIILRSFFQGLPDGVEESAKIDGCGDFGILFRIVLPLSMPALATISLFYAVNYWNSYFGAIMFMNDADKWPIQVLLRQIVIAASGMAADTSNEFVKPPEQTIKMAVIVVSTLPILIVYPFLQKYFAKGALVGSVKG
ncbi:MULTISPECIES: carbohydrate ABC transporter permease [unclassified Paenibacillus]|uniref:carbohydrate ABC transporter permease n=1 Tax=unclassified Paenibacillus TaxID=185978 RepID=UPI00277E8549|nr:MULTISPECIES: carbohydrate ABC transporter permease [unclassified Paenibacillus]MDQ0900825.1 putative aldouronate transport system permease protein [Paenibacillus sp. V4I7]MDQ0920668.1 putative aldouronate transport system permease protein [Paenibacillus sp. V4I5]